MNVAISTDGKRPSRMEPELSQAELAAIGRVTVLWAELEHLLLEATLGLAELIGIPPPEDAYSFSFTKRLRALRTLTKEGLAETPFKIDMLEILSKIGTIEQSRHRITHGLWDWLPSDPASTRAFSHRKRLEFNERFDFHKLIRLGHRIGELCFRLRYPGGTDQFLEEHAEAATQPGGVVTRSWLLMLQGKDPQNPHLPLSNYLERMKIPPVAPLPADDATPDRKKRRRA